MSSALLQTNLAGLPVRRGKVRDIYDLGERLLMISTDRISAFDWVLPTGIPDKGRVLTQLSAFWFDLLQVPHHLVTTSLDGIVLPGGEPTEELQGRSMIVRKAQVVPIECVVRGYLEGSGWREYQATGSVCGIRLPDGLRQCDQLPRPLFTPATKAESGHDVNISFDRVVEQVGAEVAETLRDRSLEVYARGAEHARQQGILIADTKFEWGWCEGELTLIDEVLTPDSSRFWPEDRYQPGGNQPSFDKQFVREWLDTSGWDKDSTPPDLPDEIVNRTRGKYVEAFERLAGRSFSWN